MNARARSAVPDRDVDVWYELCVELFPTSSQIAGRRFAAAVASVAVGGAVGSSARWAVSSLVDTNPGEWPWSTLIVNLLGCLLIGAIAGTVARGSLPWDFLVTGVLGGFTTMSAFAIELNDMVDAGRSGLAIAYGAITVAAGVGAAALAGRDVPRRSVP